MPPHGRDAIHLEADQAGAGALDEQGEQLVEVGALGCREVADADTARMRAEVGESLAVDIGDHRVATADPVVRGVLDLTDGLHGAGDEVHAAAWSG